MTFTVAQAQVFFLVLVRVLMILMIAPILGTGRFPAQVRIGLALFLAAMLLPIQPQREQAWEALRFGVCVGQEVVTGLMVGFASTIAFTGVQMAATFIGLQSGFRMASMLNPNLSDVIQQRGSSLEQIYTILVVMLFLTVDGHHWVLVGIQRTFQLVPAGEFALSPFSLDRLLALTGMMFDTALFLAIPVLGTLLLVSLALAIVARAVPQVQVVFLGAPLKMGLGMLTLGFAIPWMAVFIVERFSRLVDDMLIFVAP